MGSMTPVRDQSSEAWHDARNDAAEEGGWGVPKDRHDRDDDDRGSDDSSK